MRIDEEIEKIESIMADIQSAISECKDYAYFEYKVGAWEEDLAELGERLQELESKQEAIWNGEIRHQNIEYEEMRL